MTTAASAVAIHASAVAWAGRGILLVGEAGCGKSTLVAQLLALGGYLVADDLVRLENRAGRLHATASGMTGLIEVRGNGIFRVATAGGVPVGLCVDLAPAHEPDRLPERAVIRLAGADIPMLQARRHDRLTAGQILLALCARRTN